MEGHLLHHRFGEKEHRFSYPHFCFLSNIDDLANLGKNFLLPRLVASDKFALLTIDSKDLINRNPISLREKWNQEFIKHSNSLPPPHLYILTLPKIFGKQFNPVNFYLGLSEQNEILCASLEINNTFGEKHHYFLSPQTATRCSLHGLQWRFKKEFHVSPFNQIEGEYEVRALLCQDKLILIVRLYKNNEVFFHSSISGKLKALNAKVLFRNIFFLIPAWTAVTFRIGIHAFILYFQRKMPVYTKPVPPSPYTQSWTKPVLLQRLLTGEWLEKIQKKLKTEVHS